MMNTPKIKRPPFDFEIPEDLEDTLNELADAIEAGRLGIIGAYEEILRTESRDLGWGTPEQTWIMDYYYYRGWQDEQQ